MLVLAFILLPAVIASQILWNTLTEQIYASYEKRLATGLQTFELILNGIIGFILAWKWEFWRGIIALLGMIGLPLLRPDLIANYPLIGAVVIPALIFIWLGWTREPTEEEEEVNIT